MSKLLILVGPTGSGKSTIAERLLTEKGYSYVSQDMQGKGGHLEHFNLSLKQGLDIVVDRMNFNEEQRARYIAPAIRAGYEIEIRVLQVPYAVCLERMRSRWEGFAEGVYTPHPTIRDEQEARSALHTFYTKYKRPEQDEVGSNGTITFEGHERSRPDCIVVDLDGTLCNIDHRLHHVRGEGKPDWKSFFQGIPEDTMNDWCAALIGGMTIEYPARLVLCSGRPDDYRKQTEEWLNRHDVIPEWLFMRRRGDFRRDDIVKEVILDFEILPRYKVLFAVDDRQQVVDLWRRRGIVALQCAPGNF